MSRIKKEIIGNIWSILVLTFMISVVCLTIGSLVYSDMTTELVTISSNIINKRIVIEHTITVVVVGSSLISVPIDITHFILELEDDKTITVSFTEYMQYEVGEPYHYQKRVNKK